MDTPNVPEPSPWLDLADELRRFADDVETLVGEPAPGYVTLDIQPGKALQAETPAMVDAVAAVLLRKTPETKKLVGGTYHRRASGSRGQIRVSVYQEVTGPPDERDAELARLRAEVEKLKSLDAHGYSRADDGEDPPPAERRLPPRLEDARTGEVVTAPVAMAPLLKLPMRDEKPRPLVSDATIAEAEAMEERDRAAGGPPWEVPAHPENAQPGGWHRGQIR